MDLILGSNCSHIIYGCKKGPYTSSRRRRYKNSKPTFCGSRMIIFQRKALVPPHLCHFTGGMPTFSSPKLCFSMVYHPFPKTDHKKMQGILTSPPCFLGGTKAPLLYFAKNKPSQLGFGEKKPAFARIVPSDLLVHRHRTLGIVEAMRLAAARHLAEENHTWGQVSAG